MLASVREAEGIAGPPQEPRILASHRRLCVDSMHIGLGLREDELEKRKKRAEESPLAKAEPMWFSRLTRVPQARCNTVDRDV